MLRVILLDRFDQPIGELSESEVFGLVLDETVNGEHSLTITTTAVLEKGWRVLTKDHRGRWREHVVYGTDALHDSGERPFGTYYCTWSVQPDLMGTRISKMPGVQTPVAAGVALEDVLDGTSRWQVGTVTNTNTGGASMYDTDGWSAMSTLIATWGGEVDTTIEVGDSGIAGRKVDLYAQQGEQAAKRRYDFGADIASVRRKVEDGPLYCRVTPRGRGEETEGGGYGRKITIESVNDGKDYLENPDMVPLAKLPDGSGGWEYPTIEIENPDCETPADLKAWAQSVLVEYTAPKVTYEVDVLQLAREGVDMHGVSLGDAVQVVDRKFGDGVRISGRVLRKAVNLLDEADEQITLGELGGSLADMIGSLDARLAQATETVQAMNGGTMSTADYLSRLLDRINAEINADGGYAYITEGEGLRTYDAAVSDPLVGAEASKVVEIKGGTIRIANSRTAQSAWEWKTVFQSGHIASNMVTAVNVVAGFIGSSDSGNFWNLDTGELRISTNAEIGDGGTTMQNLVESAAATITGVQVQYNSNQSATVPPSESDPGWSSSAPAWEAGHYIWQRTATTNASGTTYSTPVMISGKDGADGTSVTILGSYETLAQLEAAHPTGNAGDAYMVAGDLYVWNGAEWEDVGTIQGPQGDPGAAGAAAVSYSITASVDAIVRSAAGAISPASVTFTATSKTGSEAPAAYPGRIRVQTSNDGSSWTNRYTSSVDQSSYVYTPSSSIASAAKYIRGILFAAGGTTTQLDAQTVAIVSNGANGTNGTNGTNGADGADGLNQATVYLYQRAASSPTKPSSSLTYTFSTGALSGTLGNWSRSIPATDGNPCWVTTAAAISSTSTDSIASSDWASPTKMVEDGTSVYVRSSTKTGGTTTVVLSDGTTLTINDGEDGDEGTPGADGLNGYVHVAWANSADGSQDFSTSDSYDKAYIGFYTDNDPADSQEHGDYSWSLIKGTDGTDGFNTASVLLYQRAASSPAKPASSLTYTFSTHSLSGTLGSWSTGVPSGTNPCWVIAATATSTDPTDTIAPSEWAGPVKLVENGTNGTNGTNGADGADGLNQATVFLYRRAASQPSKPSSSVTYTFATGALSSTPSGWSRSVPAVDGNPCWVTTVAAISAGATDSIASSDWASPTKMVEDGADGADGTDGADAYTVVLSNESHTFAGGTSAAVADSTECAVIAYKGATRVAATIGTITGKPTGMSTTVSNNGTTSAKFTVSVTASMTTRSGTLTIPLTIDGKSFTATFSYALALVGETGATGATGVGVSSIVPQYYNSTSSTTRSGGSWSEDQPVWVEGKYIWTRSLVTWSNGSTSTTTPVLAKAINSANQSAKDAQDAVTALDNSLDQEEVFNRLTNDGAAQGVYIENGNLYINGTYMKIGKISSANGRVYFDLDNNELACNKLWAPQPGTTVGDVVLTARNTAQYSGSYFTFLNIYNTLKDTDAIRIHPARGSYNSAITTIDSPLIIAAMSDSPDGRGATRGGLLKLEANGAGLSAYPSGSSGTNASVYCSGAQNCVLLGTTRCSQLTVTGTKSRLVGTKEFSDRLLYAYETPSPLFGDVGSGVIGEDGLCYVEIDAVFAETARVDYAYQVFLQKCGQGDLWVSGKEQTHFVVEGTPGLAFDWELKARQTGFEALRIEDDALAGRIAEADGELANPEDAYGDYITEIEQLLAE